jgi:hypothetical protein
LWLKKLPKHSIIACITTIVHLVSSQNMNFTKKVLYTDQTTVATSNMLKRNNTQRKVILADTALDVKIYVINVSPLSFLSIRRNTSVPSISFQQQIQ